MYGSTGTPEMEPEDGSPSKVQSSPHHCLGIMKRRMVRARSMDARATPTVPFLSISPRSDSQHHDLRPTLLTPDITSLAPSEFHETFSCHTRPTALAPLSAPLPQGPAFSPGTVSPIGAIQPDLYKKKGMLFFHSEDSQEGAKYGRLHFQLKYDFDKSDLVVHILKAVDMKEGALGNPFVQLRLDPSVDSKERRAEALRGEEGKKDPEFNEVFKFPVPFDEIPEKDLVVELFDSDKSIFGGQARIRLADVDVTSEVEVWGELHKIENTPFDRPEINLSLSYLPSARRLTVTVLKASNLVVSSTKELPDPYAKISFSCGIKKLKKKKTSIKKSTACPEWNEAVAFDVTEEDLKHSHLTVSVVNGHHGNGAVLGTCVLGGQPLGPPISSQKGIRHWLNMLSNPRKPNAMWHVLSV